ncbi:MAG TPA: EAL domain-containing protein [Devosia sp.]|nr:EAL domain-containing protein [Devosia sp.]
MLPFGARPLRTFALFIGLPAFLLYVLSAGLVIAALAIMAGEINRLADDRGFTAMHAALDSVLNELSGTASDNGTWNEAYLNAVVNSDPAWMDTTWGTTARLGEPYDNVLVTSQDGTIDFGENNAGAIKGNIVARYPAAKTMLSDLDKGIAATGDATTVSRFAADPDGPVGLAAISIHQSTPGQMGVPRQTRRILWIARHLSPALLQDLAARYQMPVATLVTTPAADSSSITLADADGNVAGTLAWVSDRPGDAAFDHAVLVATGVFFLIGVALALALGVLRRLMLRRAEATLASYRALAQGVAPAASPAPKRPAAAAPAAFGTAGEPLLDLPLDGITAGDFEIEYQPVFDLRAESMVGVEALLRWRRADGSVVPQESLAPATCAALLDRVGLLGIRRASEEVAPLLGLMLTIAVSPVQILSSVFPEKVIGTLGATGFPARRLQVSIDAALLPPLAQLRPAVLALRRSGILVALNNFALGTGTVDVADSRLVDRVRLAPALTTGVDANPARRTYLAAHIEVAHAAGLGITVPAAERPEEVGKLLRLGCREFQGGLFAPPMPVEALTRLMLAPAVRKAG